MKNSMHTEKKTIQTLALHKHFNILFQQKTKNEFERINPEQFLCI